MAACAVPASPRGLALAAAAAWLLLAAAMQASAAQPAGADFRARVLRVYDGDTFSAVTPAGARIRVRVAEIDAPEKGDPYADRARQRLRELVQDRSVRIRIFDVDKYGRIVAHVLVDGVDASEVLVREGLAAVYRHFAHDTKLYQLERQARAARRGFWSTDYRPRGFYSKRPREHAPASPAPGCGSKHNCSEMTSCGEALYYLHQCQLDSIDGDGDGLPCEKLCRSQ